MYSFDEQLAIGQEGEENLDSMFTHEFDIEPVSMDVQRLGIDRIFTSRKTGMRFAVEYKTDSTAARTGNAFVETISVDTDNKLGWAYSSVASILIYHVPGSGAATYVIRFSALRERLSDWGKSCQERQVPNDGYFTHGLLVPLQEFEAIAQVVL